MHYPSIISSEIEKKKKQQKKERKDFPGMFSTTKVFTKSEDFPGI